MLIREDTEIDAAPEIVWSAIHDYRSRMEWDSMLRRLAVDGQSPDEAGPISVGSEVSQWARWQAGGVAMIARYTECVPPSNERDGIAAVTMVRGPWFFRSFEATSELTRTATGQTLCEAVCRFDCQPRWLRFLVEPAVRLMFVRETKLRWKSLKAYLEA